MPASARPAPLARHRLAFAAGLLLGAQAGAWAAGCAEMRGGELLLRSSDHCVAQMRRDPALRTQVARTIDGQVALADTGTAAAPANRSTAPAKPERSSPGPGLGHPLARLSMLNAQSRYLWSLSNPAPTYYGQTAP